MVEITETVSSHEVGREKECYIFNVVFYLVQILSFDPRSVFFWRSF